jgi:hypothetical protein
MTCSESLLRPVAHDVFTKLKAAFQSYNIYWRLGHSFDTIIDYLAISPDEPADFGPIAVKAYDRSTDNACWYDDFGWWGIASLKALQHSKLFPDSTRLKQICDQCWSVMYENAPNVWTYNNTKPEFKGLEPRFGGGVWNADWTKPGPLHACKNMPIQPYLDYLGGIQNTVTNGTYLVLATRLHLESHDPRYRDAAKGEYDFLGKWFEVGDREHPDYDLCMRVGDGALIRERVATFAKRPDGQFEKVPGYDPELAWSGDQGIILGGLVDRMRVVSSGSPEYSFLLNRAKDIAAGVKSQVTALNHGILTAWVTSTKGGDPEDYATGPGAYWRYLAHAYQNNDDLKRHFRESGQTDFVCKNAENTEREWKSDEVVHLTNRLAALVAAIVMSRG